MNRMLAFGTAVVTLYLVAGSASAQQGEANREEDIQALNEELESHVGAYNKHDVDVLMQYWARRANFITASGETIEGYDALRAYHVQTFEHNKEIRLKVTPQSRRFLSGRLVLEDGTFEFTGVSAADTPAKGRYTAVMNKPRQGDRTDRWTLVALRTMVPVKPPSE